MFRIGRQFGVARAQHGLLTTRVQTPVAVTALRPFSRSTTHAQASVQAVQAKTERPPPPQVRSMGLTKDGRNLKIRRQPKFNTLEEERLYRKQHLAGAFRVFADRGYDEGVAGHISVRDPILTDHFCKCSLQPRARWTAPVCPLPLLS